MAANFTIRQNDTAPSYSDQLLDEKGRAVNLTGAAVEFHMKPASGAVKVNAAAIIVEALAGKVKYNWISGNTDTPGLFNAEWEVTFSGGAVATYPVTGYRTVQVVAELA